MTLDEQWLDEATKATWTTNPTEYVTLTLLRPGKEWTWKLIPGPLVYREKEKRWSSQYLLEQ
jgi:hypothetical protein